MSEREQNLKLFKEMLAQLLSVKKPELDKALAEETAEKEAEIEPEAEIEEEC